MKKIPGSRLFYSLVSVSLLALTCYLIPQTIKTFEYSDVLDQIYTDDTGEQFAHGSYFSSSYSSKSKAFDNSKSVIKNVQGEGTVLLKNKNSALPLDEGTKVSCFSRSSVDLVYTGTGSGTVKITNPLTLKEALESDGLEVNLELWNKYLVDTNYRTSGVMEVPSSSAKMSLGEADKEIFLDEKVSSSLTTYNQVGIITLSRISGEGYDLPRYNYTNGRSGYLALSEKEKDLIKLAKEKCEKTVVLINSANPMELGFLDEYDIDACLWIGLPGQYGIQSVADILVGKINPSGRLSDTYAYDSHSAPANENSLDASFIGGADKGGEYDTRNNYMVESEGIYVGYKYYETRYADTVFNNNTSRSSVGSFNSLNGFTYQNEVQFPFGYGLSYTSFSQKLTSSSIDYQKEIINVQVSVTNNGTKEGKDTVLLFSQSPYTSYDITNKIEKSAVNLVAFKKTDVLAHDKSQTINFEIPFSDLANYDSSINQAYLLEKGDLYLSIGSHAHNALNNILSYQDVKKADYPYLTEDGDNNKACHFYIYDNFVFSKGVNGNISNQFDSADINTYYPDLNLKSFTRNDYENTYPTSINNLTINDLVGTSREDDYPYESSSVSNLVFSKEGENTLSDFTKEDYSSSKWNDLLEQMSKEDTLKLVSKGGFAVSFINSIQSPVSYDRDGPCGISGAQASSSSGSLFPSQVVMASTFNEDLIYKVGEAIGEEAMYLNVTGWYAPGANIHRTPFGGRNLEYFSEDPLLSGELSKSEILGAQSKGIIVNIKHFALNDQELHRNGICVFNNEQAIRETYLQPFKIAVTKSNPLGVMSSFTRIGTIWSGAHQGLLTNVLRNEWGFKGRVVTDYTEGKSFMSIKAGLKAGNDLWLCSSDTYLDILTDEANKDEYIYSLAREACKHILYAQSRSSALNRAPSNQNGYWKSSIIIIDSFTVVLLITSTSLLIIKVIQKRNEI